MNLTKNGSFTINEQIEKKDANNPEKTNTITRAFTFDVFVWHEQPTGQDDGWRFELCDVTLKANGKEKVLTHQGVEQLKQDRPAFMDAVKAKADELIQSIIDELQEIEEPNDAALAAPRAWEAMVGTRH